MCQVLRCQSPITHVVKATMLKALAGSIPPHKRIGACEEVFELQEAT